MPPVMGAPLPRVSTIRQGASPMKGIGLVTSIAASPERDFGGLQVAGAGQFGMASPQEARPARRNEIEADNEALRASMEFLPFK